MLIAPIAALMLLVGGVPDVRRYILEVEAEASGLLRGELRLVLAPGTSDPTLDAEKMAVSRVASEGQDLDFGYDGKRLVVPGSHEELVINYEVLPSKGWVFEDGFGHTRFHTSSWMPCNFDPGDRASFSLRVHPPPGASVVGAGVGHRRIDGSVIFELEEEIPAYMMGFALGPFDSRYETLPGGPTLGFHAPHALRTLRDRAFEKTADCIAFLARTLAVPFPGDHYASILLPGGGAQEFAGGAFFGPGVVGIVMEEPKDIWFVCHEVAHQWWGRRGALKTWSENWLSEALATYATAMFAEETWGPEETMVELLRAYGKLARLAKSPKNRALFVPPPAGPAEVGGPVPYVKGPLVLELLRTQLGDRTFFAALRALARRSGPEGLGTRLFESVLEHASGRDMSRFFADWIHEPSIPKLTGSIMYRREGDLWVRLWSDVPRTWPVRIPIIMEDDLGRRREVLSLAGTAGEVLLPTTGRIRTIRVGEGFRAPVLVDLPLPYAMLTRQSRAEPDALGRVWAAERLVDDGRATPSFVESLVRGEPNRGARERLRGLLDRAREAR